MLCHRIGLIPIKADADDFDEMPEAGENGRNRNDFTDKNSIKFSLNVECPSLTELQTISGNRKAEYLTVYSKSLEIQRVGKQEELPEGKIGLVHDDIVLLKLAPGQVVFYLPFCEYAYPVESRIGVLRHQGNR